MEQRNGRVDRHGQKADKVLVHHFVCQSWKSEPGQTMTNRERGLPVAVTFLEPEKMSK